MIRIIIHKCLAFNTPIIKQALTQLWCIMKKRVVFHSVCGWDTMNWTFLTSYICHFTVHLLVKGFTRIWIFSTRSWCCL